jgi:hypothetical protein
MDDKEEKSIVEKMVDKINDVVANIANIANTASNAAAYAMESNAEKMAGKVNEQADLPLVTEPAAMPVPPVLNQRANETAAMSDLSNRITPAYDLPVADSGLARERQQYMEEVVATAAAPKKRKKKRAVKAKVSPRKGPGKSARTTAKKTVKKAIKKAAKKVTKSAGKSARKSSLRTTKKKAKKSKR